MKTKFYIVLIILGFRLTCPTKSQDILKTIDRICQRPDSIITILTDTNVSCRSYYDYLVEYRYSIIKSKEYSDFVVYIDKFFKNKYIKDKDTILGANLGDYQKYDSVRCIALNGSENKRLFFLFSSEQGKWKIFTATIRPLYYNEISHDEIRTNLKIVDSIVKNQDLILKFSTLNPDSLRLQKYFQDKKYFLKELKHFSEYVSHNYKDGYKIKDDTVFRFFEDSVWTFYHDITLENMSGKRQGYISFKKSEIQKQFLIDRVHYYSYIDTLSDIEVKNNRILVEKILKTPKLLYKIAKDSGLCSKYFIESTKKEDFLNKLVDYIIENFSNGYSVINDFATPKEEDGYLAPYSFYNKHKLSFINTEKTRKLNFIFNDFEYLYMFKLNSINTDFFNSVNYDPSSPEATP